MVTLNKASLVVEATQPRPVAIRHLRSGEEFTLLWDGEGGKGGVEGKVLYHSAGSTRVRLKKPLKLVEFRDGEGNEDSFLARPSKDTEWSLGTLVLRKEDGMGKDGRVSLSRAALRKEGEEDMAKDAKGNGKGEAKAAKAKAPTKSPTPCKCGCGEVVARNFKAGHDARYYGLLKKVVSGKLEFEKLPKLMRAEAVDVKGAKKLLAAHG